MFVFDWFKILFFFFFGLVKFICFICDGWWLELYDVQVVFLFLGKYYGLFIEKVDVILKGEKIGIDVDIIVEVIRIVDVVRSR